MTDTKSAVAASVVAANFLPLGTRVRIPELYGDRIFTVQDRMNARYDKRMDFWMKDIKEARKLGMHPPVYPEKT